jgi:hypothetical protein
MSITGGTPFLVDSRLGSNADSVMLGSAAVQKQRCQGSQKERDR